MTRTWDDLAERFGLPDFTPANQDLGAIHLIRQCKALSLIHDGRIKEAIYACRRIWASLPGAGYGQRELATEELLSVYKMAGGISIDSLTRPAREVRHESKTKRETPYEWQRPQLLARAA